MVHLDTLEREGAMYWRPQQRAWSADPSEVVRALVKDGFLEYKREVATRGRARIPGGGIWQGLDPATGTVAIVLWVMHRVPPDIHVFIEVGGQWVEGCSDLPRPREEPTRSPEGALV